MNNISSLHALKSHADFYPLSIEEFMEKIERFPHFERKKEAEKLISIAPTDMAVEAMVELVFEISYKGHIPFLLDAILARHTEFTLSPCDCVRAAIAKDDEMRKTDFLRLLNEHGIATDTEKVAVCYASADHFSHPYVFSVERFKMELSMCFGKARTKEVLENAPAHLTPEEIIDCIFEKSFYSDIPMHLEAMGELYPGFTLSPFDRIRETIVEDAEHQLTNGVIEAMFHESNIEEEKKQLCYDLAYRMNHPYIYCRAKIPTLPVEYTLNFPWINLNPQEREKNNAETIFDHGGAYQETEQRFMSNIADWAEKNPATRMNLWTDSALLTQRAWDQTAERLHEISVVKGVDLRLRDIRQLSNLEGEIGKALHPATPLFFRVDLCKALIVDHMLSASEGAKYVVVLDGDIEAMTAEEVFEDRTVGYLEDYGYVFNRVGLYNFENSFMIFNKEKEEVRDIHRATLLESLSKKITGLRKLKVNAPMYNEQLMGSQSIFNQYVDFRMKINDVEFEDELNLPRKVVQCPSSQFNGGGNFCDDHKDHRNETWRFIGNSDIPYTKKGRSASSSKETMIEHLVNFRAESLPI